MFVTKLKNLIQEKKHFCLRLTINLWLMAAIKPTPCSGISTVWSILIEIPRFRPKRLFLRPQVIVINAAMW